MGMENSSEQRVSPVSGEVSGSSSGNQTLQPLTITKKRRNLPGMPDPDAEVIALSPKTLMATNRFVCEVCHKGFQRDQNLQLHRRGHNLPWKLKQRTSKDIRKRVYVCPESSCVHHDPSRALGDLTGIKKHFCRKHGEKKWKCDKCAKKYAVQSDWKAHLKICGTREYRCDCGTLFSRRDSFITHRAFCDALAEESAKAQTVANSNVEEDRQQQQQKVQHQSLASSSSPSPSQAPVPILSSPTLKNPELSEKNSSGLIHQIPPSTCVNGSSSSSCTGTSSNTSSLFANIFNSPSMAGSLQQQNSQFSDLVCDMTPPETHIEPPSLCLSSPLFGIQDRLPFTSPPQQPTMSATALLQKAAQMGATASSGSLLRGLGISLSSSSTQHENNNNNSSLQWNSHIEKEPSLSGLEIGLPMIGHHQSTLFSPKPTTLDFLGLGMGSGVGGVTPKGGISALLTSIGGSGYNVPTAASFGGEAWEGTYDRKPSN